ncbi:MAG: valine--tRNA ligase [Pseudomonadota bacterium]|nr:valine--tRNA ligase [Pseudomonadota bacterium]
MLDKTYLPAEVEGAIYKRWEDSGVFAGGQPDRMAAGAKPYCIVIPPPNVTGSLHMGHALNNTLQDVLTRFERMRGKDVLWQPGTDHAGIATQMVVERQLMEKQEPDRRAMGREKFLERVWSWKAESGGTIINQLRRLGASCDWSRERFTMDEGLSRAVLKVFVDLYRQGLIYKDKRLVNWDPKLLTAISDLEVMQVETKGHLWHFKYPIKGEKNRFIVVATTRPETMLGDTAVAVHPEDERYSDLVGKFAVLPLVGREIKIVADEYADPEQGSGAVKITPAHDFNDFEVGRRHGLEMINIFDEHACINENAPEAYRGLDRFAARKRVVADLEAQELVEKIEDYTHTVPYGDRSNVVIEPWLTEQWYVDAATLAKPAIAAVERGETVFVPRNWEKTYFEWMRNIQPWCISRQLWWGHQIPAWYGPKFGEDGYPISGEYEVFVAPSEREAIEQAKNKYGANIRIEVLSDELRDLPLGPSVSHKADSPGPPHFTAIQLWRDPDVLDTWFSSALWPFSTLGWPEETPELARYYKTDVLVTGFDIIFFWVARMMMMGLHFMKEVPFHTVYIHALVRDEKGQKMSKSKGNVMDPLELIDEFGADALRFTLAAMAAQGRDIKLARSRVEGYRNFGTKLWNAARFLEMNECGRVAGFDPSSAAQTVNKWIAGEVEKAASQVTEAIEAYRFNDAANAIYHFVWHVFCDWYVELIKPVLSGSDEKAKAETRAMASWALDEALKLLHPFMPFITEELWTRLGEQGPAHETMLITAHWPRHSGLGGKAAADEIGWVIRFITEIRSVRAELHVPAGAKVPAVVVGAGKETAARVARHDELIRRLARIEEISLAKGAPKGAVQVVLDEATVALPLVDVIDISAETERLRREIDKIGAEISQLSKRLSDDKFVSRAPEHVVEEQRERMAEAEAATAKLREALKRLEAAA